MPKKPSKPSKKATIQSLQQITSTPKPTPLITAKKMLDKLKPSPALKRNILDDAIKQSRASTTRPATPARRPTFNNKF